ncbi:AAA family ATPase [Asticcacaulis sp. W401b]|uniref:AAA family ATPase n=1 Tax=Asticcacaulis sp. W401b TaxID=3388666 RepID=UPI0039705C72
MAVIALNSPKGGVAKTTLAILLAAECAHRGYSVALLDADPNQHAALFGERSTVENLTFQPDITDATVIKAIRRAAEAFDLVFIDLPGATTTLNLKALQLSDFVILPCQTSRPDVRDAMRGIQQIVEAGDLKGLPGDETIPYTILWTRIPFHFESKAARSIREAISQTGARTMSSVLHERSVYKEMHINSEVPRQIDESSAATKEVSVLTDELLETLYKMREQADVA